MGRYPQGAASIGQALDLLREVGDRPGQARALANLGLAALLQGDSQQAVGHFTESLALHRETGDLTGQARALGNLGFAALRQGQYGQAQGPCQRPFSALARRRVLAAGFGPS